MKFQLPKNLSHAYRIITILTNNINQKEERIVELGRRRDLQKQDFDEHIAELKKENKELQECFDECYEELQLTRNDGDKQIAELEKIIWELKADISELELLSKM